MKITPEWFYCDVNFFSRDISPRNFTFTSKTLFYIALEQSKIDDVSLKKLYIEAEMGVRQT